jgi:hypothetical protein
MKISMRGAVESRDTFAVFHGSCIARGQRAGAADCAPGVEEKLKSA